MVVDTALFTAMDVLVAKAFCNVLLSAPRDTHNAFNAVTFGIEARACDVIKLVVTVNVETD